MFGFGFLIIDGCLKEINKITFLIIDFVLLYDWVSFVFFMEFQFNLKKVTKMGFLHCIPSPIFRIFHFLTIKVLFFSNKILERNINNYLSYHCF